MPDKEAHSAHEEMQVQARMVSSYAKRYSGPDGLYYQNYWSDKLLSALGERKNFRILDCGCGDGMLMRRAREKFGSVFGADLSFELLKHNPFEGKIVQADMQHLPFKRGVLDAVLVRGALHHVPSAEAALGEIAEVLKPKGLLIFSEPNHDSLLLRLPRFLWYRFSSKFSHTHRTFSKRRLLELLKKKGYCVKRTYWFGYLAFPLCGLKDFLPVMEYLPFKLFLAKRLVAFDEILSFIPFLNRQSWHLVVEAVKESSPHEPSAHLD